MKQNIVEKKENVKDFYSFFCEKLRSFDLSPPDNIKIGKLVRFSTNGRKEKNGWYTIFSNSDGSTVIVFGNWQTGLKKTFYHSDNGKKISDAEKKQFDEQIKKAIEENKQARIQENKKAAEKASETWDKAEPASPDNSYLKRKLVKSYGLKQTGKSLLIPVYDISDNLMTLQYIYSDGTKQFLKGGKAKGGSFAIHGKKDIIYLAEGYATGATIYEATGQTVFIAFNSGNLESVALALKEKYPDSRIIIASDNDLLKEQEIGKNIGLEAGKKAAATINAGLCICPVNSDFNDLMVSQSIDAVKEALTKIEQADKAAEPEGSQAAINQDPEPLPDELLPVKPFNFALLPDVMRPWVEDICDRMQCPPDFVAAGIMAALAGVIGRKVAIRPQARTDWTVICNIWALIVGRPGVLKSPALEQALAPVKRLAAIAADQHQQDAAAFQIEAQAAKLRKEAAEKSARQALAKNPDADLSNLFTVSEPATPQLKRYMANDTSPASLGELLRQNPNGLLVYRDEIVSLLKSLDREGQEEGRGFYLTAWNGDSPYTLDRIGRGLNLHIPAVCLSVLGGTQPGRLSEYIRHAVKGGAADDGLIQRFGLLVWPDTGGKWQDVDRWPDTDAKNKAFKVFDYLNNLDPMKIGAEQDTDQQGEPEGPPFLRFEPAALEIFQEWRGNLEQRLRGELHPALESHFAKYRKLIPSLALICHLADGTTGPVTEKSTLRALAWGEYLETHAQRAYGAVSQPEIAVAKAILQRIQKGDLPKSFSSRDVWRPGWAKLTDRDQVKEALQLLEDYNWITMERIEDTGGRPKTVFHVNERVSL